MTKKQETTLEALSDAAIATISGLSLPRTLQRIANNAREMVNAKYAALGVPSPEGTMRTFVTSGLEPSVVSGIEHEPHGKGLLGAILEADTPIRLANLQEDPRSSGFCGNHPPMTTFLGVPIIGRNHQRLGNLYLCDRGDGELFTEADEKLVTILATFAAIAIENSNLHNQLQEAALIQERDRIAMELHDGIIQLIYAVGMKLEIIRGHTTLDSEEDKRFQSVFDDLNRAIDDIRTYIRDLRSVTQAQSTFQQKLTNLAQHFKDFSAVDVVFDMPNELPALTDQQRHSILQIVRETLANVARHAEANHVKVSIHSTDHKKLYLAIQDDGRGFNMDNVPESSHFGLQNMQTRARRLGGTLQIESEPNRGTTVYLVVPLRRDSVV
ncbi:MAG: GAF domain-containing sensor histidine kinase [Chloroflexi bacterium]|nr:GAF domain-containing sensor histidine kinase [Chloroflexota bacterium]